MRIYVGNLPFDFSESKLTETFSAHGKVTTAQIVMDRDTNRSKGFGFVEMPEAAEANAAIKALHGKDMGGRPLTVNEARPREDRGSGGGGGGFRKRY